MSVRVLVVEDDPTLRGLRRRHRRAGRLMRSTL